MRLERQKVAVAKQATETTIRRTRKFVTDRDEIPRHQCWRLRQLCPSANVRRERWAVSVKRYQVGKVATSQIEPYGKVHGHKEVRSHGIPTPNQRPRQFGQHGNVRPREKDGGSRKREWLRQIYPDENRGAGFRITDPERRKRYVGTTGEGAEQTALSACGEG